MNVQKLNDWAELLLDHGKRSNLINFKETKTKTLEILLPTAEALFEQIDKSERLEIYDPGITDEAELKKLLAEDDKASGNISKRNRKSLYCEFHSQSITRDDLLLIYSSAENPLTTVNNINRASRSAIEEMGVNTTHLSFGFINWTDSDSSNIVYKAPILLVPIKLERESAIDPYFIKANKDEVVVNPTFSHKLFSEHGVSLPPYEDEGLTEYLDKIKRLLSKLEWSVTMECWIGQFSFQKINMYRDLKDNVKAILRNKNIRALLGEGPDTGSAYSYSSESSTYRSNNPLIDLHNVVDADSSQIEAIEMAKSGESFVLQGPPGTGKSQTITNIIAECLHDGKKVLFVSEKMAALNVVYDKLKQVGLSEFCLELHSNKANKKDFINEIYETLVKNRSSVSNSAERVIAQKEMAQERLDTYAKELHLKRDTINKSLYCLYENFSSYRSLPDVNWAIPQLTSRGDDYLLEASSLLEQYVEHIPTIGYDYRKNPWYGYIVQDSSFQTKSEVRSDMSKAKSLFTELLPIADEISEMYDVDCGSLSDVVFWLDFFRFATTTKILTPQLLDIDNFRKVYSGVESVKSTNRSILTLQKSICLKYDVKVLEIEAEQTFTNLSLHYGSIIKRFIYADYKKLIEPLKLYKKDQTKVTYPEALEITQEITKYQNEMIDFSKAIKPFEAILGDVIEGSDTDWGYISQQLDNLYGSMNKGVSLGNLPNESDFSGHMEKFTEFQNKIEVAFELCSDDELARISSYFDTSIFDIWEAECSQVCKRISSSLAETDKLDNWYAFRYLLSKLEDNQITSYLHRVIENNIEPKHIADAYKKLFYFQWMDNIISSNPVLASFNRISHDNAIKTFAENDREHFSVNQAIIRQKLSSLRPSREGIVRGSPVALIQAEHEKKRRKKSIRSLLIEAGELIQQLKPCFMMSPLSVSTFLEVDSVHFDLVVFDEASQIFPQDAIGSIYRAEQMIVVGDSKQLPPTDFFMAGSEVDDLDTEDDSIRDYESILDVCSSFMSQRYLSWHYRSRFEQLIAFSNKNFYHGNLTTFPSSEADKEGIGIDYHYVNGVYNNNVNLVEAEFTVKLIYQHFEEYPNRSLGVVTFNRSQQDRIDKLLLERREKTPAMERFFDENVEEPFFIKNLETVQGDERDTIILSTTFGKDPQGRLYYRFGPINRQGGERRLNVAVSRAKSNMKVVSSLRYTDLDLKKSQSEGVRLIREYLDFAENGTIALDRSLSVNSNEQFDSPFESEVYDLLVSKGFSVDTQVGCSGYRLDLALKRPDSSDYVLAIECDGASYHSSRNARDRDRLRQEVLEGMGWEFHRIWSTDWYRNSVSEQNRLLTVAEEALKKIPMSNPGEPHESSSDASHNTFEEVAPANSFEFEPYREADIETLLTEYLPDRFLDFVKVVLDIEAPLSEEYLLRRILRCFDRQRITKTIRSEFESAIRDHKSVGIIRKNGFLYLESQQEFKFRNADKVKRELQQIAPEELGAGLLAILEQNIKADKNALYNAVAKQCGISRCGNLVVKILDSALSTIEDRILIDGDQLSLK